MSRQDDNLFGAGPSWTVSDGNVVMLSEVMRHPSRVPHLSRYCTMTPLYGTGCLDTKEERGKTKKNKEEGDREGE